jgi:hypothetical protein
LLAEDVGLKRAGRKSIMVDDKAREKRDRGSKKKLYQESNGICRD